MATLEDLSPPLSGGLPLLPLVDVDRFSIDLDLSRRKSPALMTSDRFPSSEDEEGPPERMNPPAGRPFAFRDLLLTFFFPILTSKIPSSDLKVKFPI